MSLSHGRSPVIGISVRFRTVALCATAVAVGGCAHTSSGTEQDPVGETIRQMTALTSLDGEVVCAASHVESERALQALLDTRPERVATPARRSMAWTLAEAEDMNLSQVSEKASQSLAQAQSEARSMAPGASLRSARARAYFDTYAQVAGNPGVARVERGAPTPAELSWASAQFAAVWAEYFGSPEGSEERALALDWLTARAMAHPMILGAYRADFDRALEDRCADGG